MQGWRPGPRGHSHKPRDTWSHQGPHEQDRRVLLDPPEGASSCRHRLPGTDWIQPGCHKYWYPGSGATQATSSSPAPASPGTDEAPRSPPSQSSMRTLVPRWLCPGHLAPWGGTGRGRHTCSSCIPSGGWTPPLFPSPPHRSGAHDTRSPGPGFRTLCLNLQTSETPARRLSRFDGCGFCCSPTEFLRNSEPRTPLFCSLSFLQLCWAPPPRLSELTAV